MDKDNAIRAAKQIGLKPGETVVIQTEGQINNPHHHAGQTSGETHVDGWEVTNTGSGIAADKHHSDG
ncbi:MAG TPA: hypothetical protein VGQ38_07900 [Gaiellaceae bacterium]|nr:hypothetical protein [Gaiellaceae bacterium]